MIPEIKAQWLAALRSGEFTQGYGFLRTEDNTYCCLGVLCELAARANVVPPPTLEKLTDAEGNETGGAWDYGGATTVLPREVAEWAGLGGPVGDWNANPVISTDDSGGTLAGLNDHFEPAGDGEKVYPNTFGVIASLIEEYL